MPSVTSPRLMVSISRPPSRLDDEDEGATFGPLFSDLTCSPHLCIILFPVISLSTRDEGISGTARPFGSIEPSFRPDEALRPETDNSGPNTPMLRFLFSKYASKSTEDARIGFMMHTIDFLVFELFFSPRIFRLYFPFLFFPNRHLACLPWRAQFLLKYTLGK